MAYSRAATLPSAQRGGRASPDGDVGPRGHRTTGRPGARQVHGVPGRGADRAVTAGDILGPHYLLIGQEAPRGERQRTRDDGCQRDEGVPEIVNVREADCGVFGR